MPITINLGRINLCLIVGTKDRFIEVKCEGGTVGCVRNCWECVNGACVAQVGGQFDTEAECLLNPQSNTCITAGSTDSGVVGSPHDQYNWMATNQPVATFNTYYFDWSPLTCTAVKPCITAAGCSYQLDSIQITDAMGGNSSVHTDATSLVAFIVANINASATLAMTFSQLEALVFGSSGMYKAGQLTYVTSPCECEDCGIPPVVSWECYEGPAGSYCQDPGDGSGPYPTEADCLLAISNGVNLCDSNGVGGGARVNGAPGVIFIDQQQAQDYYTDPTNGVSGIDAMTLFFEVEYNAAYCSQLNAGQTCCEGPNSTLAVPTSMVYLRCMVFSQPFWDPAAPGGSQVRRCCFNPINPQAIDTGAIYVPYLMASADYQSWYGNDGFGNDQSWTWDEVLTDAINGGVVLPNGMNTAWNSGSMAFGFFNGAVQAWQGTFPAANAWCASGPPWTAAACVPGTYLGPYSVMCQAGLAGCIWTALCYCEEGCEIETFACDPVTQLCYDPFPLIGPYTGPTAEADCIAAGCGNPDSWDCINGNCQSLGNASGPYGDKAACIAGSGWVNTCDTKIDISAALTPNPCNIGQGCEFQVYDWHVTNGTTATPWDNYFYDSGHACQGTQCCPGYTTAMHIPNHFTINKQNVMVYMSPVTGTTVDDLVAWCNANIGPGFLNTMTWSQMENHSYTFPGWAKYLSLPNIRMGFSYCNCSCGTTRYECIPGAGCQPLAGGTYATHALCLAAMTGTDTCSLLTYTGSFANLTDAINDLTINHPATDITTLTSSWGPGGGIAECTPALTPGQTQCTDPLTNMPSYEWGGYIFYDMSTGGPLAGLNAIYLIWNDFITDAQAIPIAGIAPGVDFDTACTALNTHFGVAGGTSNTCTMPLAANVITAPTGPPGTPPPSPAGCFSSCLTYPGFPGNDNSHEGINGPLQYITIQGNGLTSAAPGSYNWLNCDTNPQSIVCPQSCTLCGHQTNICSADPTSGCPHLYLKQWELYNLTTPNGPTFATWDLLLADLITLGVTGVTTTSTYDDVMGTAGGPQWGGVHGHGLLRQWAAATMPQQCQMGPIPPASPGALVTYQCPYINGKPECCECATANVTVMCAASFACCVCDKECPPPSPTARAEALVLWLHADRADSITTTPPYPVIPPSLENPPIYYVTEWHNLAYDPIVGVLPYDPTAYYTYDTITPDFTTAPIYDTSTFAPHTAILFDEKQLKATWKFLIANPDGPAPPTLEPDTNPNVEMKKGWTIFFLRCTSEDGWRNANSWFMGDDMSVSDPGNQLMASGLQPAGQPYCRSMMFGHSHADKSVPNNEYKASFTNKDNSLFDLYLPEGCYLHWIVATETLPTGTANNTYSVEWGIGSETTFTDIMTDLDRDTIIANINTRNRDKDSTQSGWYKEIRAYNCAFTKQEIIQEVTDIERYWGPSSSPQPLPPPCGLEPGVSIAFDGVDETRVEVQEAGGNKTILPSTTGFTAAFWVRFNDCGEEDGDACLFEKGINLPADNEQVAFRLFLTNDVGEVGKLYWDVFGDKPVDYTNNYSRTISTVPWLGEESCVSLIGKWKHVAVTMDDIKGTNRKIYIDGIDKTGPLSGAIPVITGQVRRNTEYPLNIGDSSRVNYTFKGNISQFITWDTELDAKTISKVYNNGELFAADINEPSTFDKYMGVTPYDEEDRLTFYTNFDTDPITHETSNPYTITSYGGVTMDNDTIDVPNAILPTDIGDGALQCWFKSNSNQYFDFDFSDNDIARATYMTGNTPYLKDKLRHWECHAGTGRYIMSDALNDISKKYLYQQSTITGEIEAGGLYFDSSEYIGQMQIFHTKADGGIQFPACSETAGAFTIMIKVRLEAWLVGNALYGNTTDNIVRVTNANTIRVKIGGPGASDFTTTGAMTTTQPYIITLTRDNEGNLRGYIDGGAFDDAALIGSFTDADAFVIDYLGGIGPPGDQAMQGWIFDFLAWDNIVLNDTQRKSQYRVINETIKTT